MEAKNYRLGNIVDLWGSVAYIQRCDFSENEHGIAVDEAKPIPITEKWLSALGFEEAYNSEFTLRFDYDEDNRFDWMINKQNKELSGLRFKGNTFYKEVKYVHELQNFFFAITKTELSVKHKVSV